LNNLGQIRPNAFMVHLVEMVRAMVQKVG
jgi:hypothetical protein